eukprot:g11654.t1
MWLRLLTCLFCALTALAAPLQKDMKAYKMLACDACRIIMEKLSKDVRYLSETEQVWPDAVLDERLALACQAGHLVLQVTDAFDE